MLFFPLRLRYLFPHNFNFLATASVLITFNHVFLRSGNYSNRFFPGILPPGQKTLYKAQSLLVYQTHPQIILPTNNYSAQHSTPTMKSVSRSHFQKSIIIEYGNEVQQLLRVSHVLFTDDCPSRGLGLGRLPN